MCKSAGVEMEALGYIDWMGGPCSLLGFRGVIVANQGNSGRKGTFSGDEKKNCPGWWMVVVHAMSGWSSMGGLVFQEVV